MGGGVKGGLTLVQGAQAADRIGSGTCDRWWSGLQVEVQAPLARLANNFTLQDIWRGKYGRLACGMP